MSDGESDAAIEAVLAVHGEQSAPVYARPVANDNPAWRAAAKAAFLSALAMGRSVRQGCRVANVGRTTVYEWRDNDDDFRRAWLDAEQDGLDLHEDLVAAAGTKDWRASARFLEAKGRWTNASRVDVKSEATVTATVDGQVDHSVSGTVSVALQPDLAWLGNVLGSSRAKDEDQVPLS